MTPQNVLLARAPFFVESISDGGCCLFIDNAKDVEAGDDARVLRNLSLGVVEVRGNL